MIDAYIPPSAKQFFRDLRAPLNLDREVDDDGAMLQFSLVIMALAPLLARALLSWEPDAHADFLPQDIADIELSFENALRDFEGSRLGR